MEVVMADAVNCSVCGKKIGGILGTSLAMSGQREFWGKQGIDASGWCQKCMDEYVKEENKKMSQEIEEISDMLKHKVKNALEYIELLTTPPPASWDGIFKGIVSGHAVIGTGPLTEIVSAWTDFFGEKSYTYQEKIREGEEGAILDTKFECLKKGANFVVGCNISIQEATNGHGMLMISCAGTAYQTRDVPEIIIETYELIKKKEKIQHLQGELKKLSSF